MPVAWPRGGGVRRMNPHNAGEAALIRFLQRSRLLSNEAAVQALQALAGAKDNTSVIDILSRKGIASEEQIAQTIARGLKLPYVDLPAVALDAAVVGVLREDLAVRYAVVRS